MLDFHHAEFIRYRNQKTIERPRLESLAETVETKIAWHQQVIGEAQADIENLLPRATFFKRMTDAIRGGTTDIKLTNPNVATRIMQLRIFQQNHEIKVAKLQDELQSIRLKITDIDNMPRPRLPATMVQLLREELNLTEP